MRSPIIGVMIARGDLAFECGYERLAEAQEEILWMCEAAHVLDRLGHSSSGQPRQGRNPSRAEISDAVLAQRAECVMLNKGPYILPAIKVFKGYPLDMLTGKAPPKVQPTEWLHHCSS